jgi:hypothetical protein
MSSVVISGDTSGAITLAAPAVAGTTTLTLPTTTGTLATLTTPSFGTTIGVGGATASTSGAGISFPATQSASSDANTLDDYEEGTWTPVYEGTSGSIGSTAYSTQAGRYTKIGRMVFATAEVVLTNKGSWTSSVRFAGLPFTTSGATETAMGSVILGTVDFSAGQLYANPRAVGGNSTTFYIDITSDNADRAVLSTTAVANTSIFYLNMVYTVS